MIPEQPGLTSEERTWANVAIVALTRKPPQTTWEIEPYRDYQSQRLSRETMIDQLCDRAARADPAIRWMVESWGQTGRLPSRRRDEGAFLRLALLWSTQKYELGVEPAARWPGLCPSPKASAALISWTWSSWMEESMLHWASEVAEESFKLQEFIRDSYDPLY